MNDSYEIRTGSVSDLSGIAELFREQLSREPNETLIVDALRSYPSVVVYCNDTLIAFAYCGYMAPDLLEIMNIAIHSGHRSTGLGSLMLDRLHSNIATDYSAVMLTNSVLYTEGSSKRAATNFYLRNGYSIVASTGATNMFWKSLK